MLASTNGTVYELSGLETTFGQNLQTYLQNYDIATSDNMADVHRILLDDNSNTSVIDEQDHTLHLVITRQWVEYQSNQDHVLNLLKVPTVNYATVFQALVHTNNTYADLKNSWQTLVNDAAIVGTTVADSSGPSFITPLIGYTAAALLLVVLIIVGTGYLIDLTITRPLDQLVLLTRRIANGETHVRAEIKGRDEIDAVAYSINNMLDHIVLFVQGAKDRHENLQLRIDQLINEVSGLGAGDLTVEAEVTMDELGVLAESFNYMTQELSDLVIRVKVLAKEVGTTTRIAFEHMTQLVQISTQQNQQIIAAATKVADTATASKNVAKRIRLLSEITHNAHDTAQSGRNVVQQAMAGTERISQKVRLTSEKVQILEERSHEIDDMVKVISDIAHQTNRLALDAAIQAAIAGENAHAFAAIATDIRSLSERSKEQALMISQLVHAVLEEINSATHSIADTEHETVTNSRLINEAAQALDSICSVVEQQAEEMKMINQVTIEQLESSSAIVQVMQKVSDSTWKSNATTRETSRLMERVALLAKPLYDSVHVFKVQEDSVQQITNATLHAISRQFQSDRAELNSSQQTTLGSTTRPLPYDLLLLADQSASDQSAPYPPSPTSETPIRPQE
jgi:methyl-accepting chemotaxis protein